MNGATHVITGLTLAVSLGYTKPSELAVVAVASLIADIDRQNSLLGRLIPVVPSLIEKIFGKRTITHNLIILGLGYFLLLGFGHAYANVFALGYASHLLLDLPTGSVALLFPIPKKFTLNFGIPPVFIESAYLMGMGVYYLFHWKALLAPFLHNSI